MRLTGLKNNLHLVQVEPGTEVLLTFATNKGWHVTSRMPRNVVARESPCLDRHQPHLKPKVNGGQTYKLFNLENGSW